MPKIESEYPPINQTPIRVKQGELDDLVVRMGSDAYNQRFTVSLDGKGEGAPQSDEDYYDELEGMRVSDLPKTVEQQPTTEHAGYDIAAQDMIGRSADLDSTQSLHEARAFIDALMASVDRGEVTVGGKTVDASGFKDQIYTMLDQYNLPTDKRDVKDPLRLIPSGGGMRDAFAALLGNESTSGSLLAVLQDMKFRDEAPGLALQPVQSSEVSPVTPKTPKEEVAKLPIEIQRAIKDYEMYMASADASIRANGHNRDAEGYKRQANGSVWGLPTAMRDLAMRYYKELNPTELK